MVTQQTDTQLDKGVNRLLYFPDFTFWATAIGGRVHDNSVIVVAAAYLALHKFYTVVYQPADGCILQA